MIGSLRGTLLRRGAEEVLVEVGGIGYRCTVTPSTAAAIGEVGSEVFLHVHHHVREDVQALYGFATYEERAAFAALITARGVGPTLGMAILSVHPPDALRQALATDDIAALCLVPGVGHKTATRLLVELKSRLDIPELDGATTVAAGSGGAGETSAARAEVREALAGLGYGPEEVRDALAALPDDAGDDASVLLKAALRSLASVARS